MPTVYYETNNHTYVSFWIGLDGEGTSDLWQAGTELEIQDIVIFGIHFVFTSHYAWTEFLPPQGTEQVLRNLPVTPGDLMFSQVWVGNPGQSPSLSGLYAITFVEGISRGEYSPVYTCRGFPFLGASFPVNQVKIGGSEAEWIMERPMVGGSLPDLSDYNYTFMYDAYAQQTNGTWMNYDGANNQQIFMYNGKRSAFGSISMNEQRSCTSGSTGTELFDEGTGRVCRPVLTWVAETCYTPIRHYPGPLPAVLC